MPVVVLSVVDTADPTTLLHRQKGKRRKNNAFMVSEGVDEVRMKQDEDFYPRWIGGSPASEPSITGTKRED